MRDEVKPCNLDEILARAAKAARSVDVQDAPAVTMHSDDACAIGDVVGADVPAMAAEIKEWRAATIEMFNADIAGDRDAIAAALERMHRMIPADKPHT